MRPAPDPQDLRRWLLEHVCPFWATRIVDPQGGFFESLDAQGHAGPSPARTVLNQARLTYVFSHASVLAGGGDLRAVADHGFDFVRRAGARGGDFAGWHRSTSVHGEIIDPARDTYDQAFVIFAMAWYHRATGSPEALHLAAQTYEFMERHLADGVHGGFFEEFPHTDKLPRRQNPHMHLLEATLAMHAASGDAVWLSYADKLIALFTRAFVDGNGTLGEYFDARWRPAEGAAGALREPGHQFEWVWLLAQYMRQSARQDLQAQAQRLFEFGVRHGLDPRGPLHGMAFDGVNADGAVLTDSKLVWPQTEYIKACVARWEATGDAAYRLQAFAHLGRLRSHFFYADGASWVNHVSRDGAHLVSGTPARILYHVFLACAELLRIAEAP
ncbi:MAG TPA: AGE family epimerase/isomerase [Polyangia bacterium]|nr:AGE family epimerase/isomerase [Polyangia bacterium]